MHRYAKLPETISKLLGLLSAHDGKNVLLSRLRIVRCLRIANLEGVKDLLNLPLRILPIITCCIGVHSYSIITRNNDADDTFSIFITFQFRW